MGTEIVTYSLGRAVCPKCRALSDSSFARLDDHGWHIHRQCKEHGSVSTLLDVNGIYFREVLAALQPLSADTACHARCETCARHPVQLQAAIMELLDECDTTCRTCVASSAPGLGNVRSWLKIKRSIDHLDSLPRCRTLMISGGEPTIHPQFERVVEYALGKCRFENVIVITNGRRLASDPDLLRRLSKFRDRLEVHLQYDSDRQSDLDAFRGNVTTTERNSRLASILEAGLRCTLICIVADGVNLDYAERILDIALSNENIVGVTYQPLRRMGRLPAELADSERVTTLGNVVQTLESYLKAFGCEMKPHVSSPHSVAVAYLPRGERILAAAERLVVESAIYPSASKFGKHGVRVLVNAYLDNDIYCELFAQNCAVGFVVDDGNLIPIDTYYLFYHN